jgi:hypothetical protein
MSDLQQPHEGEQPRGGLTQSSPRPQPSPPGRTTIYLAAALVALIAGSGLFVSGFALGHLQGSTAGTGESRQELFRPFWDAYNDITTATSARSTSACWSRAPSRASSRRWAIPSRAT